MRNCIVVKNISYRPKNIYSLLGMINYSKTFTHLKALKNTGNLIIARCVLVYATALGMKIYLNQPGLNKNP